MKKTIFTALLLCIGFSFGSLVGQVKKADKLYKNLAYSSAVEKYEKANAKTANNLHIIGRIADCYRLTNNSIEAEKWYKKELKFPKARQESHLHYAMALMNNEKWEQAIPHLETYQQLVPDDGRGGSLLKACQNRDQFLQDSVLYVVELSNINSEESDFSPNIYKDELVFASARKTGKFQFKWLNAPFLQLFIAEYNGSPKLGEVKMLRGKVNSDLHEGHVTFSPDGNTMIFSRNNVFKGTVKSDENSTVKLKSFLVERGKRKWGKIQPIPYNSDEYSVGHPALSPDGKKLYFVSDMKGGYGGTDLYVATVDLENGNWGTPKNLGPEINSPGNEMFPWVDQDGNLYFASNGLPGLGGLDIFRAQSGEEGVRIIKNMGYPINSSMDDFALVVAPDSDLGFFSSNRPNGIGDDDIYSFRPLIPLRGKIVDANTQGIIEGSNIEVYDARKRGDALLTDSNGEFLTGLKPNGEFLLVANKPGYKEKKIRISSKGMDWQKGEFLRIELEKAPDAQADLLVNGLVQDENGNPLSNKNIKIVEKGWVLNSDKDGKVSTRISPDKEYQLIYDGPDVASPIVLDLNTSALEEDGSISAKLVIPKPAVDEVFYIIYYNYDKYNIREFDAQPELDRLAAFMQSNPSVRVKLIAHTDSRASKAYNQALSKNRAKKAVEYLVSKGVVKTRMEYEWKGETQLVNECGDGVPCSEEKHQLNRRTEVKVVSK